MVWNNKRALNRLKSFCNPRLSGTPDLIKARDIIFNDLKKNVKSTIIEDFHFHDELHRVSAILGGIFFSICLGKLFTWEKYPWLSVIFGISLILMFLLSFFNIGIRMTSWLYKNKGPLKGYNIIGELPAADKEKQILVLGAHYDTKSTTSLRNKFFPITIYSTLITTLTIIIYGIIRIFTGPSPIFINIILYIAIIWEIFSIAFYLFYTKFGNESPGVNDNGSGVLSILELAEIYSKKPPKFIKLIFLLFDAEELGMQGSAAYMSEHGKELGDINTWMINFDSTGGHELSISLKGGIPIMNHGKELIEVFETAINSNTKLKELFEQEGFLFNSFSIYPASDHMNFYFSNIPSASLGSSDAGFGDPNYHSAKDNLENFQINTCQLGWEIVNEFILTLDKRLEKG